LLSLVLLAWLPLGAMVLVAFTSWLGLGAEAQPPDTTTTAIAAVWRRYRLEGRLIHSAILSLSSALIGTALGFAGAYGLAYLRPQVQAQLAAFLLVARVLPVVAVAAPLIRLFAGPFGGANALGLGLAYSGWCSALAGWLFVHEMAGLIEELRPETAILGATEKQFVFSALLPHMRSTALAVFGVNAVMIWNETFLSSLFRVNTVTQVVASLITQRGIDWPSIAAVSLAATLPPAVVALLAGSMLYDRRNSALRT